MKVLKLRQRLQAHGFTLLQDSVGSGFTISDNGVKKLFEEHFDCLEDVKVWFTGHMLHNNRLNEEECDQWDKDFEVFCVKQNEGESDGKK